MTTKSYAKPRLERTATLAAVTAQQGPTLKSISGKLLKTT